jgi:hypothetical protein
VDPNDRDVQTVLADHTILADSLYPNDRDVQTVLADHTILADSLYFLYLLSLL